jgi:hypothetical protein
VLFVLVTAAALLQSAAGLPAHATRAISDRADASGIGIRLLEAPTNRRRDPRARIYIVDHLSPGTTIKRRIEVSNVSSKPQHVEVYAAAADISHNRFQLIAGRPQNELSSWTSLTHPALDLKPHSKKTVRVTIKVPRTASKGERYGVVWGQTTTRPDATHNVGIVKAVGIRMYLDIGPGGEPSSDFRIEKLTPIRDETGRPKLLAQLHNTGGRALDISGTLTLTEGPGGLKAGPYAATTGVTLAPGTIAPVTVVLDKRMPNGPWKIRLVLQSGMVKQEVTTTITFPTAGIGKSAAMTLPLPLPVLLAGLAGLAALTGLIATLIYRRTRQRRDPFSTGW